MKSKASYKVIGIMSGTSLDGLDIICCIITKRRERWYFEIKKTFTKKYSNPWREKLTKAHQLTSAVLIELDHEYGEFIGDSINDFIRKGKIRNIDFIASHGHTVFHQPDRGFTFQIGNGNAIYAATSLPVINDFRSLDVRLGGQGAPLVPIGDQLLFGEYHVCLNLGGIANLSLTKNKKSIAFDVCFANMGLNYLSVKAGNEFDKNGILAASGNIDHNMLASLNQFYRKLHQTRPSLGREGFEKSIRTILDNESIPLPDRVRTCSESIANEIARAIGPTKSKVKLLATGGGALNHFLMKEIKSKLGANIEVHIPEKEIIQFKESLVFALLGVLKVKGEINVLRSVTGASRDSSSGVMIGFQ